MWKAMDHHVELNQITARTERESCVSLSHRTSHYQNTEHGTVNTLPWGHQQLVRLILILMVGTE